MTPARDRITAIIRSTDVNGIDFVEIANEDQTRLNVHFLNSAVKLEAVAAGDVTITGGETIPSVRVRAAVWRDPLLEVTVDAPGDFSTYTLAIKSTKLDFFRDRMAFSFKALCPSSLDCEPAPHVCPPEEGQVPPIDYLAKDFISFRAALSDFSAVRFPDWRERNEADFGIMFMEALAAVADDLSYLQDRIAGEATLETATQRRSVVRHARLVDYEPRPLISSHVVLQFDVRGVNVGIPAGVGVAAQGADGTRVEFETGTGLADTTSYPTSERWNRSRKLAPYIWDDSDTCVEAGATELWIAGKDHEFEAGQRLLIETAAVVPGDPPVREVVTLTRGGKVAIDTLFTADVTHIVWAEPLKRDHDISTGADGNPRTTVSGNLVPATQGRTMVEEFFIPGGSADRLPVAAARMGPRDTDADTVRYFHTLGAAPLTSLRTAETFVPEIEVIQGPPETGTGRKRRRRAVGSTLAGGALTAITATRTRWDWQRNLINADPADLAYAVEPFRMRVVARNSDGTVSHDYDGDGGDTIVFGDGVFGASPPASERFEVTYRIGDGSRGNVAPDSIRSIDPGGPSAVVAVTNPFPAEGGEDEEPNERVRRLAPQAFRATQFRAVRAGDYAAAAETLPWVSKAGTVFRWAGSWLTAFTTVDPKAGQDLSVQRRIEVIDLLNRYRLAGYESYVLPPRYASLDLIVELCASPEAFRGDVEAGVLEALDSDHFFHADRFTFGTPLERSALEAAVQAVPGVAEVLSVAFRRRGVIAGWPQLPLTFPVAANEIVRIENDPSRPERGSIRLRVKGGK